MNAARVQMLSKLASLPVIDRIESIREGVLAGEEWLAHELLAWLTVMPSAWAKVPVIGARRAMETERACAAAQAALVSCWSRVPEPTRVRALRERRDWSTAVADAQTDERVVVRRGLAAFVLDAGDPSLFGVATSLLLDEDRETSQRAENALVRCALRYRAGWMSAAERDAWASTTDLTSCLTSGVGDDTKSTESAFPVARIMGALDQTLRAFASHRRRGVMLVVMALLDRRTLAQAPSSALREVEGVRSVLRDPQHPAHDALLSVLRSRGGPEARLRALEWLSEPAVARAAVGRLARAQRPADHAIVLESAHVLLRPSRRAALTRHALLLRERQKGKHTSSEKPQGDAQQGSSDSPIPDAHTLRSLTSAQRAQLGRWLVACNMDAPTRRAALLPLLSDLDAGVRFSLLLGNVHTPHAAPSDMLSDLVLDVDPAVSRSAYLAWRDVCEARQTSNHSGNPSGNLPSKTARTLAMLSRMPHENVRRHVAMDAALGRDEVSWEGPRALGVGMRASALEASSRPEFWARLAQALSGREPGEVMFGLDLLRRFPTPLIAGASHEVHHALSALAQRTDAWARHAAQAVTILGLFFQPEARRAVQSALGHSDPRVRANAVEAWARHLRHGVHTQDARPLLEWKGDAQHRVRASAIRVALVHELMHGGGRVTALSGASASPPNTARQAAAQLYEHVIAEPAGAAPGSVAAEAIAQMLTDDRPGHRLAGMWLAGKVLPAFGPLRLHARWPELVGRVAEAARFDADPSVRARAGSSARLIDASLRSIVGGNS
jgi:hypothetical protein